MYCFDEWFAVKHNEDFLCQKSDQVRNSVQPASVVLVDFTNACRLNAVGLHGSSLGMSSMVSTFSDLSFR